jgi:hypothetical protein
MASKAPLKSTKARTAARLFDFMPSIKYNNIIN